MLLSALTAYTQDLSDYGAAYAKTGAPADALRLCLKIGAPEMSARDIEKAVGEWEFR